MKKLFLLITLFFVTKAFAQTTFVVTSANDFSDPFTLVPGELRWAIEQANLNTGHSIISFNIPVTGTAPITINLNSTLPPIRYSVTIDGNTQPIPGYTSSEPKIIIDGSNTSGLFYAIRLGDPAGGFMLSNGSTITNLKFNGFTACFMPVYSNNNFFLNNVCMNSYIPLYHLDGSSNNVYKGNYINTDHSLTLGSNPTSGRPSAIGLQIIGGAIQNSNTIGGVNPNERNYFYHCDRGVSIEALVANYNKVQNNIFINNIKNIELYYGYPGCSDRNNCKVSPVFQASYAGGITNIQGTSAPNDFIEIYLSNVGGIDALELLGTTTANSSGQWSSVISNTVLSVGSKIIATATDTQSNTSEFSEAVLLTQAVSPCCSRFTVKNSGSVFCKQKSNNYFISSVPGAPPCSNVNVSWNFGDGTILNATSSNTISHSYANTGTYTVLATVSGNNCSASSNSLIVTISTCDSLPCEDCIGSFAPTPNKTYIVSAWVKEGNAPLTKTAYTFPNIVVECPSVSFTSGAFYPTGAIIDGWQRIEGEFTIPDTLATDFSLNLNCTNPSSDCYFDDVRVFPIDGSMKSYVYNPVNMRLEAELDERNYATIYEYDEEGKLLRVKKETEKGIMTIKESRNNTRKQ